MYDKNTFMIFIHTMKTNVLFVCNRNCFQFHFLFILKSRKRVKNQIDLVYLLFINKYMFKTFPLVFQKNDYSNWKKFDFAGSPIIYIFLLFHFQSIT